MTTIHTIEDLLHVLDENPDWVDALRARLLTHELIELPEKFTQFVAEMNSFVAEVNKFVEATKRRFDALEIRVDSIQKDVQVLKEDVQVLKEDVQVLKEDVQVLKEDVQVLKEDVQVLKEDVQVLKEDVQVLKEDVQVLKEDVQVLKEDVQVLKEDVQVLKEDVGVLKVRVKTIQDDIGTLKGAHARNAAIREASLIAEDMGLKRTKTLTQDDLGALVARVDMSGIPTNELRSFRRADLMIEATDQDGKKCYIAVEISFTVNGRDTTRALRNARFLTQFTGRRSYAAVAGLRRDDRIHGLIESGEVFWYALDPEVLEAE